jgi:hypothetical protein
VVPFILADKNLEAKYLRGGALEQQKELRALEIEKRHCQRLLKIVCTYIRER